MCGKPVFVKLLNNSILRGGGVLDKTIITSLKYLVMRLLDSEKDGVLPFYPVPKYEYLPSTKYFWVGGVEGTKLYFTTRSKYNSSNINIETLICLQILQLINQHPVTNS